MITSVIIPTCDRDDELRACLERLAPSNQALTAAEYEVIVSDDGLRADAQRIVTLDMPWARYVQGPRQGPAANRNSGASHARGEWLIFTDDDCLPEPGFVAAYLRSIAEDKGHVLEGRTMPAGTRTRVDMECPANQHGGYLWSCNLAVSKTLFWRLGGFDTRFPGPAMEDVDFRMRVLELQEPILFVPDAVVLHPWRRRKGFAYHRLHALSYAYCISKHPQARADIGTPALLKNLVRRLVKEIPLAAMRYRGRGAAREIGLALYSSFILFVCNHRFRQRHHP